MPEQVLEFAWAKGRIAPDADLPWVSELAIRVTAGLRNLPYVQCVQLGHNDPTTSDRSWLAKLWLPATQSGVPYFHPAGLLQLRLLEPGFLSAACLQVLSCGLQVSHVRFTSRLPWIHLTDWYLSSYRKMAGV
jgi:hypothetical protein